MTASATTFPPEAASVPTARRFVRAQLEQAGLPQAWEAAEMLVSEIVTNAVLHARTDFTVEVLPLEDVVRVSVLDRSPAVPRQRAYAATSTTGRGMRLVASLAAAWGVEQRDGGKSVWFEVPSAGGVAAMVESWYADVDLDALMRDFDDDPASDPTQR